MNEENDILEKYIKGIMNESPTFSDEMMEKVRNELLNAANEAEKYYNKENIREQ